NMAFGDWLVRHELDDMDKGDRSRLFAVMKNLPEIEGWRQRLPLGERLKLNHPNTIWRRWKEANSTLPETEADDEDEDEAPTEHSPPPDAKPVAKSTLPERDADADEEDDEDEEDEEDEEDSKSTLPETEADDEDDEYESPDDADDSVIMQM